MRPESKKRIIKNSLLFFTLFIVLVIGGHYFLEAVYPLSKTTSTDILNQTPQPSSEPLESKQTEPAEQNQAGNASCASDLQASTEKNKTAYEKGTIIATFNSDVSFTEAKNIVNTYGATIQDESQASQNFGTSHLVTILVPQGQEFNTICDMRLNNRVHYAGLNVLINLHE